METTDATSSPFGRVATEDAAGTTAPCAVCDGTRFSALFDKQGYAFRRCDDCSLVRLDPLPKPDELARVYEESYRDGLYSVFAEARDVRIATALARVDAIRPHVGDGAWLDVGCSTGAFLEAAGTRGIEIEGFDLSEVAVAEARERGLKARQSTADDFEPERAFGCITAFDLVEHLVDPNPFLDRARTWLQPGAKLAITVPDIGSMPARVMGKHWYYYAPPVHVNYFDRTTIARLLKRHGLTAVSMESAPKILTVDYTLSQLEAFNPLIHKFARVAAGVVPAGLRTRPLHFPVGEILVIASS